ncbi:hypothetical protein UlMin_009938 [Ulmus minor]
MPLTPQSTTNSVEPLYERFRKQGPPTFEGSNDPLAAEEWLRNIERILDFMKLSDQERIMCATYRLTKDARYWWEVTGQTKDLETLSWTEFVQMFNRKYFNPTMLLSKEAEFNNIQQGNMTATVANTSGTMTQPVVITPNNFQQQYSKPNNWRSGNSNRPQGQNHGRNKNFNNKRRWASNNHQQTQLGYSPRPQPQNCPKCGKVHPGVCRMGSNLCYTCGMEGHFSNRCPKKLASNRLDGPRLNQ